MHTLVKFAAISSVLLLIGGGCVKDTSQGNQAGTMESWKKYTWNVYNPVLKKDTTVTFNRPSNYQISEDKKPNYSRLVVRGPKGRVEIANTAYYDALPAPETNPAPERLEELDELLPKEETNRGRNGDFFIYSFYLQDDEGKGDESTVKELYEIIDSVSIRDISQ